MNYKNTQPYRVGKLYKELGEALMNPKTDVRDLVTVASKLGLNIGIGLIPNEDCEQPAPTSDSEVK